MVGRTLPDGRRDLGLDWCSRTGWNIASYPNVLIGAEARQIATARVGWFDGSDLLPGRLENWWSTALQRILQRPARTNRLEAGFQKKAQGQSHS
jgi:hypothetical protein